MLRNSAEIEALAQLLKLQESVRTKRMTEDEAALAFQPHAANLPDCEHHHHKTKREARRQEKQGTLSFLRGFEDHYAEEQKPVPATGRRYFPGELFSGDLTVGRLEMYSNG